MKTAKSLHLRRAKHVFQRVKEEVRSRKVFTKNDVSDGYWVHNFACLRTYDIVNVYPNSLFD